MTENGKAVMVIHAVSDDEHFPDWVDDDPELWASLKLSLEGATVRLVDVECELLGQKS